MYVEVAVEAPAMPGLWIPESFLLDMTMDEETFEYSATVWAEGGNGKLEQRTVTLGGFDGITAEQMADIIIAYEPVWAIGTGKTATADQAEEMHAFIRGVLASKYGEEVANNTSILYGGSCKPSNAAELFAKPNVDGGLIGGASLEVESFMGIVTAF